MSDEPKLMPSPLPEDIAEHRRKLMGRKMARAWMALKSKDFAIATEMLAGALELHEKIKAEVA